MKIAFVSANRETMPHPVVPLGLLYVMGAVEDRHEKRLWDLCFEADPLAYLRERLHDFEPDLIALGMRNIQTNNYDGIATNLEFYRAVMAVLREHGPAPVVVGGGGFSVMPAELMELLRPDYGIQGEGEEAFPRLVSALERGRNGDLDSIGALYRFRGGELAFNPRPGFFPLERLPAPDRSRIDPRYYGHDAIDSLQSKRGCVLKCDYCTYPRIEGARTRLREPARVAEEFIALDERARHVFIVDSVFNLPLRHAKEVCRELIARGNEREWTCYANPIAFDEELAELMAAARCAGMEIGSDSGRDEVLQRLKKGFDTAAIRRMHDLVVAAGMKDCHTFILGTEGETLDDVQRTLDFAVELEPYAAIMMVWVDDAEAFDPAYAGERARLREEVYAVLRERCAKQTRWVVPQLALRFDEELFALLRRIGMVGPHWQNIHLADIE